MEFTREIYWNVGSGVLVPMYLITLVAVAVLVYGFVARYRIYNKGKPLERSSNKSARLINSLTDVLSQRKVMRASHVGLTHSLFFWSFILLFIGTTLIFIQVDITGPLFGYKFLKGGFYKAYSLILDIAGLVAILAITTFSVRRYIFRPVGLESKPGDLLMLVLLMGVLITGFMVEGLRMAATELHTNMELAYYSPVGLAVAKVFFRWSDESLRSLHTNLWWVHFAFVIGFFISIPFTKFRHMFLIPVNYYYTNLGPTGALTTMDLEDESLESYGAQTAYELNWKDLLDSNACVLCKRCQDNCPAYATGKPLSPMKIISVIDDSLSTQSESTLIEMETPEALWSCVTCRACEEVCPASIEHVDKIVEMRRYLALMDGKFPGDEVTTAMNDIEVSGNPLGMAPASRADWAKELELSNGEGADIIYFTGCYASYDKRNNLVAQSFIRITQAAGVKLAILGNDEKCCGDPARKMGNEYLYQTIAAENIEQLNNNGAKKVVTTCPHCFNTLSKDYRDLGLELEVEHYTTYIHKLLSEGSLNINSKTIDVTYHDSCYMGRYNNIFDQPRELLNSAGAQITEMEKSRDFSFCCGGGGGMIMAEEKGDERINAHRVKMAEKTEAGVIVSNCPFCLTMFEDGVKTTGLDGKLTPRDMAEIIAERL